MASKTPLPAVSTSGSHVHENAIIKWIVLSLVIGFAPLLIRMLLSVLDPISIPFRMATLLNDPGLMVGAAAIALAAMLDLSQSGSSGYERRRAILVGLAITYVILTLPAYGYLARESVQLAKEASAVAAQAQIANAELLRDSELQNGYARNIERMCRRTRDEAECTSPCVVSVAESREREPFKTPVDGMCEMLYDRYRETSTRSVLVDSLQSKEAEALHSLTSGNERLAWTTTGVLIVGVMLGLSCAVSLSSTRPKRNVSSRVN